MGSRENSETKSKSFIHEHFLRIPVPRSIIFERSNPNPLFPSFSCILATNLQKRIAIPIAFLLKKKPKSFEPLVNPFMILSNIISSQNWQIVRLIHVSSSIIDWWHAIGLNLFYFFPKKEETKSRWSTRAVDNYCLHVRSHVSDSQRGMHVHAHVSYANADGG